MTRTDCLASIKRAYGVLQDISQNLKPVPNLAKEQVLLAEHKINNAALFEKIETSKLQKIMLERRLQEARNAWEDRGFFNKLFAIAPGLDAMAEEVKRAEESTLNLVATGGRAWEKIQNDMQARLRATQCVQENKEAGLLKSRCESLIKRLENISTASKQSIFNPPDDLFYRVSGNEPIPELLAIFENNMDSIECYINTHQPQEIAENEAIHATEQLLSEPIQLDASVQLGSSVSASLFDNYRQLSMESLISMRCNGIAESHLPKMISRLRAPSSWQHTPQWLVFWTAMVASEGICRGGAINDGEDVNTLNWVGSWKAQTKLWPKSVNDNLECDPAFVYSLMSNTAGESESGADVMLAFCTCDGPNCTVRLVYIQFKRTPPATCVASVNIVHDKKFDQYDRVSSWHDPESGTTAIYGMFSPKLGIIETVSAMDVVTIKHAINKKNGGNPETSHDSWELKDGRVNWTANAESMPTLLAKALGGMTGFTSLDTAIDWIDNKLKRTSVQPKYWVIQAMGGRESALNKNLSNPSNQFYASVKSLAEKYGYQKSPSLEHKPKISEMGRF